MDRFLFRVFFWAGLTTIVAYWVNKDMQEKQVETMQQFGKSLLGLLRTL